MSAVEALAEVLDGHLEQGWDIATMPGLPGPKLERDPRCICGWRPDLMPGKAHEWRTAFIAHESTALVAAIRSMPAGQVAELIGGEVSNCWKVEYDDGSAATFWEETEAREYADECRVYAGDTTVYPAARAVTPWLPLGVSPETNGEQK